MGEDDGPVVDNLHRSSFRIRIKCTRTEAAVEDQEPAAPDRRLLSGSGDGEVVSDRDGGDKSPKEEECFIGGGGGSSSRRTNASRANPTCPECGKAFPSDKSLFGHLRCHPERDYRGANPPPPEARKKTPQPGAATFAARSLPATTKWPTARRGRKPAGASTYGDPAAKNAASILLLLADSKPSTHFDASDELDFDEDGDDFDRHKNEPISMSKRLKRLKIKKDPELKIARGRRIYRCALCLKAFTSHQALGGHRASHNKHKTVAVEVPPPSPPPPQPPKADVAVDSGRSAIAVKVVDAAVEHRCKICNLIFATGQALGGHQRRHFNEQLASVRAPTSSTDSAPQSSESGGNPANHEGPPSTSSAQCSAELGKGDGNGFFEFDLNEVPRLE